MTQKFTFAQREEGFDNHISQSIRGYNDLIGDVINLSQYFVENDTYVYDIGCSTGKMLKSMIRQNSQVAERARNYIQTANLALGHNLKVIASTASYIVNGTRKTITDKETRKDLKKKVKTLFVKLLEVL